VLQNYGELAGGFNYRINRFTFRIEIDNILNSTGLTEGDPRADAIIGNPNAPYFNGRAVFPRSSVASVSYRL